MQVTPGDAVAAAAVIALTSSRSEVQQRVGMSIAAGLAASYLHRCIRRRREAAGPAGPAQPRKVRAMSTPVMGSPAASPTERSAMTQPTRPPPAHPAAHHPQRKSPTGSRRAFSHQPASLSDEALQHKQMTHRNLNLLTRRRRMAAVAPNLDQRQLVVIMVGMPGSGKSYTSQRLVRYARWRGIPAAIFNAGNYRRKVLGSEGEKQDAAWFDPSNRTAHSAKEEMARMCLKDLIDWLNRGRCGGEEQAMLAVFDATNSTRERREWVFEALTGGASGGQGVLTPDRVLFVELVCTNEQLNHKNALAKLANDDYKDFKDKDKAVEDFERRRAEYRKVYEPICVETEPHFSFIRNENVGHDFLVNNIRGDFPVSLVHFAMHLQTVAAPIYVTLSGASDAREAGLFTSNDGLNDSGRAYAKKLREFLVRRKGDILREEMQFEHLEVWTSTEPASRQTAADLSEEPWTNVVQWGCLNEINFGEWEGKSRYEVPGEELLERDQDRFMWSYPRGESLYALQLRLEPVILEIERTAQPLLIIVEREVSWCLMSYLADRLPSECAALCDLLPEDSVLVIDLNEKVGKQLSKERL
eukprot:TRINITY_DN48142_c0_g1_i1.p1 TRINITY_DN48142_c0_g1~~TRINITY_DN48142_c0_g1_i1.p1  ORF type:complete len:585 (+),score=199.59 TRINITY_DN48142_c0_g1_i1:95-1849(+)